MGINYDFLILCLLCGIEIIDVHAFFLKGPEAKSKERNQLMITKKVIHETLKHYFLRSLNNETSTAI